MKSRRSLLIWSSLLLLAIVAAALANTAAPFTWAKDNPSPRPAQRGSDDTKAADDERGEPRRQLRRRQRAVRTAQAGQAVESDIEFSRQSRELMRLLRENDAKLAQLRASLGPKLFYSSLAHVDVECVPPDQIKVTITTSSTDGLERFHVKVMDSSDPFDPDNPPADAEEVLPAGTTTVHMMEHTMGGNQKVVVWADWKTTTSFPSMPFNCGDPMPMPMP